jgi:oligoendopeptidase F
MRGFPVRFPILFVFLFLLTDMSGSHTLAAQQKRSVPTRGEIDIRYTWDPSSLYESDESWEEAFAQAEKKIEEMAGFDGNLAESGKTLLKCLQHNDEIGILVDRLSSYSSRKRDVDLNNSTYQAMSQRIQSLQSKRRTATAFIEPEILSIRDDRLNEFLQKEKGLRLYRHYLDDLTRLKAHILPKEQEELLSMVSEVTYGSGAAFGMLTNADFSWSTILDEENTEIEMSRSRYLYYMTSPDRRVRHDAYTELYVPYEEHMNTLTSLLVTKLKTDFFLAGPNVPVQVYHNLINTLNTNLDPLHRWAALKKRVLGVDELHPYDTYAPLFPEVQLRYTYEEAQNVIREAFKPLGEEIGVVVEKAFSERWIDVYENVGKRGGAYSSGTYGVHPYILMNFNGTLSSVFTLAHELGHTIHTYLSHKTQPFIYSDYATFNAEVASTTSEAILMDYLLENAETDGERLALLQQYIQDIGSTFYRQGRFAEFELLIHEKIERGEPLTHEILNPLFGEMYQKYWGPAMVVDEEEKLSWSRISHFYYNYYMYAYATSFAASQAIATKIREEGQPAVDNYLKFLSSGGSDYPVELLKIAGVDMSTPTPIEATTSRMDDLLDQMEEIISRQ